MMDALLAGGWNDSVHQQESRHDLFYFWLQLQVLEGARATCFYFWIEGAHATCLLLD